MKNLSTFAQSLADEIRAQDWSDAHNRADGARHDRQRDRTKTPMLTPDETETIRVNVMWVAAQALADHDPNFDIHAFAEAAGVDESYRLRKDGTPSGGIAAGIRWARDSETFTPEQLAALLGYDEERPGRVVRRYLREKYPDHPKSQRWMLTAGQARDVLSNVPRAS